MLTRLTFVVSDPVVMRRIFWFMITLISVVATFLLAAASERARESARNVSILSAWRTNTGVTGAPADPAAVYRKFSIRAATGNADLTWQVGSASELRASLRALDAANISLSQVKVSRSGANFMVSAERAP